MRCRPSPASVFHWMRALSSPKQGGGRAAGPWVDLFHAAHPLPRARESGGRRRPGGSQ